MLICWTGNPALSLTLLRLKFPESIYSLTLICVTVYCDWNVQNASTALRRSVFVSFDWNGQNAPTALRWSVFLSTVTEMSTMHLHPDLCFCLLWLKCPENIHSPTLICVSVYWDWNVQKAFTALRWSVFLSTETEMSRKHSQPYADLCFCLLRLKCPESIHSFTLICVSVYCDWNVQNVSIALRWSDFLYTDISVKALRGLRQTPRKQAYRKSRSSTMSRPWPLTWCPNHLRRPWVLCTWAKWSTQPPLPSLR